MFTTTNAKESLSQRPYICLILLVGIAQLFNPESLLAQSTVSSSSSSYSVSRTNLIPNSISAAQRSTEAMLARPTSSFSIRDNETMEVSDFIHHLNVTVFIDINLEGCLDPETEITFKTGVSMAKSLDRALLALDAAYTVASDGSILLISIDDELEPDYMATVIYDVSNLAGTVDQARRLEWFMMETVNSDSWEDNGSGNGTASLYVHNGRILMAINQSYRIQQKVRSFLTSTARLGGSSPVSTRLNTARPSRRSSTNREHSGDGSQLASLASSIVQVPVQQSKEYRRQRRGFARPGSNLSGGFGGNVSGGVF